MKLGLLQFGGTVYNLNPTATLYPSSAPAIGALVPGTIYPGSGTTLIHSAWNESDGASDVEPVHARIEHFKVHPKPLRQSERAGIQSERGGTVG